MNDPVEYEMAFLLIQKAYDEFERINNIDPKFNIKEFLFSLPFL